MLLSRQDDSKIILRYLGNVYCKSSTWRCLVDILKMSYREKTIPRQSKDVLKMSCAGWEACTKTFNLLLYASLSLKQA